MAKSRALPERYRQAWRVEEGYEVRTLGGEWLPVVNTLRIYAPANIVRLDLGDGSAVVLSPAEEVMSRRPAVT